MAKSFQVSKSLGFHLNRVAAAMRADFARRLGEQGFRVSDWAILAAVEQGATTPTAVAQIMALDPAVVTRTADRLVELGLLVRATSESDARSSTLGLTQDGRRTVAKLALEAEATNRHFTKGLSGDEIKSAMLLLDRMFQNQSDVGD